MDENIKTLFKIVSCSLRGEKAEIVLTEDQMHFLSEMAHDHKISALLYYGILSQTCKNLPSYNKLRLEAFREIVQTQKLLSFYEILSSSFVESGIAFVPIKGVAINNIYPLPNVRFIVDIDVLIRKEQYDKIKKVMTDLGCVEDKDVPLHDYGWFKDSMHVELHHTMSNPTHKSIHKYYKDVWAKVKNSSDGSCYLSNEDTFIMLFSHFVKHFVDGGIGLKHAFDLYQYRCNNGLDEQYIENEIVKLGFLEFYHILLDTFDVWFLEKKKKLKIKYALP